MKRVAIVLGVGWAVVVSACSTTSATQNDETSATTASGTATSVDTGDTATTDPSTGTTSGSASATDGVDESGEESTGGVSAESTDDGSTGGSFGESGTGDGDETTGDAGGTTTGGDGGTTGLQPGECNEMEGVFCGNGEWCDYPDMLCGAGQNGSCQVSPQICPQIYDPVCGCNGVTYSNACSAASQGQDYLYKGECQ